jgi:uncharacterized protein (TIGR03000 family)
MDQDTTPENPMPVPADAAPVTTTSASHSTYGPLRNSASLSVKVAADAKVFINDHLTSRTGTDREYASRDLQDGVYYKYAVRVESFRNGHLVTENKAVELAAGQSANFDFTHGKSIVKVIGGTTNSKTRTSLIVRVPSDAKLYLSGQPTTARGPVREFATDKLPAGSQYGRYQIRAVVGQIGRQQIREQTVLIKGGESQEVDFDFEAAATEQVARGSALISRE